MADNSRIPRVPAPWTPAQRGVLIGFVFVLCAVLLIRLALNRQYVSDPQPIRSVRFHELADRLDPNEATWQELAVLPQIGEKRAREIVATRERWSAAHPGEAPFQRPQDLFRVRGIGPALVETVRPYLIFPSDAAITPATTQPEQESAH